jgi:hypothetical protein
MQTENARFAAAGSVAASKTGPQWMTRILLLAVSLGLCERTYWLYDSIDHYQRGYWKSFVDGVGSAPEQYRIGVKLAAWWMVEHLGWGFRHGFVLMDVAGTLTAVFLLYALLRRKQAVRNASPELQWFASAAFVALACFYLAWANSFFRPETLPTVGFVAVMVWLWSSWKTAQSRSKEFGIALALIAASFLQAWIRADVPVALNAGMLLACLMRREKSVATGRAWKIVVGVLCVVIAAAVQLYLMKVKYPHATYGPIPVLMIRHSWRRPLNLPPFICFMVPVVWTFVQFWRQRAAWSGDEVDSGLVIASVMYLLLWGVMGKLNEVRIFVPFALALAPLTVELAMRRVSTGASDSKTLSLDPSA